MNTMSRAEAITRAAGICQNNLPCTIYRAWDRSDYAAESNLGGVNMPELLNIEARPLSSGAIETALELAETHFDSLPRSHQRKYVAPVLCSYGPQWRDND